jgi:hypothetical protein
MTNRPARLHRLAKSIPWYWFLGFLNVYKFGLLILIHTSQIPWYRFMGFVNVFKFRLWILIRISQNVVSETMSLPAWHPCSILPLCVSSWWWCPPPHPPAAQGTSRQSWARCGLPLKDTSTIIGRRNQRVLKIYRGPCFLAVAPLSFQQVVSFSQSSCVSPVEPTEARGGGGRSQIIRQRESLLLYKSFNTLWSAPWGHHCGIAVQCIHYTAFTYVDTDEHHDVFSCSYCKS